MVIDGAVHVGGTEVEAVGCDNPVTREVTASGCLWIRLMLEVQLASS